MNALRVGFLVLIGTVASGLAQQTNTAGTSLDYQQLHRPPTTNRARLKSPAK